MKRRKLFTLSKVGFADYILNCLILVLKSLILVKHSLIEVLLINLKLFRPEPFMSDGFRRTIEDPDNRVKIVQAIQSGCKYVETSDGTYQIRQ